MTVRYESREIGVWDRVGLRLVVPGGGGWHEFQQWIAAGNVVDPDSRPVYVDTQADLDAMAERDARAAIIAALKAHPQVQALVTRSPADVDTWINTNVTDLTSAKVVLRVLAYVVAILARERLGR